ncbi:MAG: cell division/cell wall cluster transcriptional repressor MraZ [Bacteroidaceae bacterium]|nr:cell division/cell wall cluster transcriptional repressor MraZ [Bacteroidaceae bacterium]
MRFFGDFSAKVDVKGRVILPAAFRKVLEAEGERTLYMRIDFYQECLIIYPESVWNRDLDELESKLNKWNRKHQDILRKYVAGVEKFELDGNGRFLINKRKMEKAGIKQDIIFQAVTDKIEVWGLENYQAHFADDSDDGEELEAAMAGLEL